MIKIISKNYSNNKSLDLGVNQKGEGWKKEKCKFYL